MYGNAFWKQLQFVTGNPNKVKEASDILEHPLRQTDLKDLVEVQTSDVAEIVRHKVLQAHQEVGGPVLVEDSGLVFEAWRGLPGALVKWFEASVGCEGMLRMLRGFDNRAAVALCYVAVHDGRDVLIGKGEVRGTVAETIRGQGGFGWDVIFIPEGHERTFAEMTAEEKNTLSHRRRAFEDLKKTLAANPRPRTP